MNTLKSLDPDDRIDIEDHFEVTFNTIYEELLTEKKGIEEYNEYIKAWTKWKNARVSKLSDEELIMLNEKEFVNPKEDPTRPRDKYGNILHNPRCVFMIFERYLTVLFICVHFSTKH